MRRTVTLKILYGKHMIFLSSWVAGEKFSASHFKRNRNKILKGTINCSFDYDNVYGSDVYFHWSFIASDYVGRRVIRWFVEFCTEESCHCKLLSSSCESESLRKLSDTFWLDWSDIYLGVLILVVLMIHDSFPTSYDTYMAYTWQIHARYLHSSRYWWNEDSWDSSLLANQEFQRSIIRWHFMIER